MTPPLIPFYNAVGYRLMEKDRARQEKEAYVCGLFSSIAGKYDLMNGVLSLARHRAWRRYAVLKSSLKPGDSALDVCCGTGDFAFELAKIVGQSGRILGTDFSRPMIEIAQAKAARSGMQWVEFLTANTCELPFSDGSFDCVTVGFGVRNLADVDAGLAEMVRVLKPGGRLVCLETGEVRSRLIKPMWRLFFHTLTPHAARLFGAKKWAYEYLPRSAKAFYSREELVEKFEQHCLVDVTVYDLMFGAVCMHIGTRAI